MTSCISESRPIARKHHRCEECGRLIAPGQRYLRQFNTDGGDAWTFKAHEDCAAMGQKYRTKNFIWSDDWLPLWELLEDQAELNAWRGFYPHPVCRLEFRFQHWGR